MMRWVSRSAAIWRKVSEALPRGGVTVSESSFGEICPDAVKERLSFPNERTAVSTVNSIVGNDLVCVCPSVSLSFARLVKSAMTSDAGISTGPVMRSQRTRSGPVPLRR